MEGCWTAARGALWIPAACLSIDTEVLARRALRDILASVPAVTNRHASVCLSIQPLLSRTTKHWLGHLK